MTDPNPALPEDPQAEGLPDTADDTSTAYDDPRHPRFDDSSPALPADEPVAIDDYGVTGAESYRDEPLSARLVREEPDVGVDDARTASAPDLAEEALDEQSARQAPVDADVLGAGVPVANDPDSAVSGYEVPAGDDGRPVGRIVEPDEGLEEDTEGQSIGYDSGEMAGLSAEEAAMSERSGDDVPYH